MRPITVTVGPLAAGSANAIALSQTPTTGALTLNGALASGGVATMDKPRRVLITTTADETARTFTITGTNVSGNSISEVLAGVNNTTTYSVLDYATVTSITISGNAAGALTVGTNGIASSAWVRFDGWANAQVAMQFNVTGTVNYTLQGTLDDPNSPSSPVSPSAITWVNTTDTNVVGATATKQSNFAYAPMFARILLNSGSGSVTGMFLQHAVNPA